MIHRCADDGQSERHVDSGAKAGVLQYRQPLVVIHSEYAIVVFQPRGVEQGIRRQRADQVHSLFAQPGQCRDDDVNLLPAEMP